jgi:hypothetical protein
MTSAPPTRLATNAHTHTHTTCSYQNHNKTHLPAKPIISPVNLHSLHTSTHFRACQQSDLLRCVRASSSSNRFFFVMQWAIPALAHSSVRVALRSARLPATSTALTRLCGTQQVPKILLQHRRRIFSVSSASAALVGVASACRASSHVRAEWLSLEPHSSLVSLSTATQQSAPNDDGLHIISKPRGVLRRCRDWVVHLVQDGIRLGHLFLICTPCALLLPIAFVVQSEWLDMRWAQLLARSMEYAGPAFIKLGQVS